MLAPWKKCYDQKKLDNILKSRDITLPTKVHIVKATVFQVVMYGCRHVWMWDLDYKEGWVSKNLYFWTVVKEKTLESHLDCKRIKPVNPKRPQSWIFTGRTDAEAEAPILWPLYVKSQLIRKDPHAGKDWRRRGWQRTKLLDGIMTQWTWVWASTGRWWSEGQGSLVCCSPWGHKESDTTDQPNNYQEYSTIWSLLVHSIYTTSWRLTL